MGFIFNYYLLKAIQQNPGIYAGEQHRKTTQKIVLALALRNKQYLPTLT